MTIAARPRMTRDDLTPPWGLSEREIEILQAAAGDISDTQIARVVNLSPATVRTHLKNIYRKVGVGSRTGAVVKAIRSGVIA